MERTGTVFLKCFCLFDPPSLNSHYYPPPPFLPSSSSLPAPLLRPCQAALPRGPRRDQQPGHLLACLWGLDVDSTQHGATVPSLARYSSAMSCLMWPLVELSIFLLAVTYRNPARSSRSRSQVTRSTFYPVECHVTFCASFLRAVTYRSSAPSPLSQVTRSIFSACVYVPQYRCLLPLALSLAGHALHFLPHRVGAGPHRRLPHTAGTGGRVAYPGIYHAISDVAQREQALCRNLAHARERSPIGPCQGLPLVLGATLIGHAPLSG